MKTTLELADALLRRAKRAAARRGTTLEAVIEDALRRALEQDEAAAERRPAIQTHVFGGRGLQPGCDWSDWEGIRARAYEGRGA